MLSLNQLVHLPRLNGMLMIIALVVAIATPLVILNLHVHIFVEKHKPTFSIHRKILIRDWVVAMRSIKPVDDVFWKKHDSVESDGTRYEIYGRVRSESGSLADARDISVLGGMTLLVTLTKSEVEAFRRAFRELRDAA